MVHPDSRELLSAGRTQVERHVVPVTFGAAERIFQLLYTARLPKPGIHLDVVHRGSRCVKSQSGVALGCKNSRGPEHRQVKSWVAYCSQPAACSRTTSQLADLPDLRPAARSLVLQPCGQQLKGPLRRASFFLHACLLHGCFVGLVLRSPSYGKVYRCSYQRFV
jgi:hypothetical protein